MQEINPIHIAFHVNPLFGSCWDKLSLYVISHIFSLLFQNSELKDAFKCLSSIIFINKNNYQRIEKIDSVWASIACKVKKKFNIFLNSKEVAFHAFTQNWMRQIAQDTYIIWNKLAKSACLEVGTHFFENLHELPEKFSQWFKENEEQLQKSARWLNLSRLGPQYLLSEISNLQQWNVSTSNNQISIDTLTNIHAPKSNFWTEVISTDQQELH